MVERLRERGLLAQVLLALAAIYLIWGSTFLAIRIAIEHMPPLLMCAVRLLAAGALLLAWARVRGTPWPRGPELRNAALVGVLLPGIGNGSVTLGETHVPSGLVALLVGSIPLWMALLAAVGPQAVRPRPWALAGLLLGFAGIVLLVGPRLGHTHAQDYSPAWALIPVAGALSWSWGSLWSRRARLPASPVLSTAIGLVAGGALLLAASAGAGEFARWDPALVTRASWASWAALGYLIVFGSVIGFTAYLFLLRHVPPALVSTYAFVNPIVALVLGVAFAHERLGARTLLAGALVIVSVILITTSRIRNAVTRDVPSSAEEGA